MSKRLIKLILLFGLLIASASNCTLLAQEFTLKSLKRFYTIGTAGINGSYYPLGCAIAKIFNKYIKNIAAISEPTKGSIANIEHLRRKQLDLALVQSDIVFKAFTGSAIFKNRPFNELKIMASLYPEILHIVVLKNSDINTFEDLQGKTISIGSKESGSSISSLNILKASKLNWQKCNFVYYNFTKSIEMLKDGYIDALMYTGGVPANGISILASKIPVKFINIPPQIVSNIIKQMPYLTKETINAGSYEGLQNSVNSVGIRALLVTTERLENSIAYKMLKVIFSNTETINKLTSINFNLNINNALKGVSLEMLHAGAIHFFKEQKLLSLPTSPKPE